MAIPHDFMYEDYNLMKNMYVDQFKEDLSKLLDACNKLAPANGCKLTSNPDESMDKSKFFLQMVNTNESYPLEFKLLKTGAADGEMIFKGDILIRYLNGEIFLNTDEKDLAVLLKDGASEDGCKKFLAYLLKASSK